MKDLLRSRERGGRYSVQCSSAEFADNGRAQSTETDAYLNLLKANIGPGCLSMPFAFSQAGVALGPVAFVGVAAFSIYNMHLLLQCKHHLESKSFSVQSYGEIVERTLGTRGKEVAETSLMLVQLGICCVIFNFVAESYLAYKHVDEGHAGAVLLATPFLAALCLLRELKSLVPFSLLANIATVAGLGVVVVEAGAKIATQGFDPHLQAFHWETLPIFLGLTVYSFEGDSVMLPVENSMREPERFPSVLNKAMGTVFTMLLSVGLLCYLAFGDLADVPITVELLQRSAVDAPAIEFVNILLGIAVFLTFPLQMRPAVEVVERRLAESAKAGDCVWLNWLQNQETRTTWGRKERMVAGRLTERTRSLVRVGLVSATALGAAFAPNIGVVISLVGSGPGAIISLVFPPLLHLSLFGKDDQISWQRRGLHMGMLGLGVSAMLIGTYSSGSEALAQFKQTADQCSTTISEVVEDPSIAAETARRVIPIADESGAPRIGIQEDGPSEGSGKATRLIA